MSTTTYLHDLIHRGQAATEELDRLGAQLEQVADDRRTIIAELYDRWGLTFGEIGHLLSPDHPISRQTVRAIYMAHNPKERTA